MGVDGWIWEKEGGGKGKSQSLLLLLSASLLFPSLSSTIDCPTPSISYQPSLPQNPSLPPQRVWNDPSLPSPFSLPNPAPSLYPSLHSLTPSLSPTFSPPQTNNKRGLIHSPRLGPTLPQPILPHPSPRKSSRTLSSTVQFHRVRPL